MRRFFVTCLSLLLSLNMFALAPAASAMQPATPTQLLAASAFPAHAARASESATPRSASDCLVGGCDCQAACDTDPDEPPAGSDVPDCVHDKPGRALSGAPGKATAPPASPHPDHCSFPRLRPPRMA